MTAKELLHKYDYVTAKIDFWKFKVKEVDATLQMQEAIDALAAVVALHSPEGKPTSQCSNCKRFYPCHTIQAIIKELE